MNKLFIVVNDDWFFLSHRKEVAQKAKESGYDVSIIAKDNGYKERILSIGLKFIDFPINKAGRNIFWEIKTLLFLFKLYKDEKPNIVHHVGLKTILWGSIASIPFKKIYVVNAISGLGILFSSNKYRNQSKLVLRIIKQVYKSKKNIATIFQNKDDRQLFGQNNIITNNDIIINGSGVDLEKYIYSSEPKSSVIKIVLSARMIKEKGVEEFVEAAQILKPKYKGKLQFILCGRIDSNPSSISVQYLESICDSDYLIYLGHVEDMFRILVSSHIVTLPSYYREGIPKSLIEAAAIGRPIITTNSIGCKDTVIEGFNGFRIPIKSPIDLADKIKILVEDRDLRVQMGKNSRILAEREFSIKSVENKHLKIYNLLSHNIN